jgi:hypothetical protein
VWWDIIVDCPYEWYTYGVWDPPYDSDISLHVWLAATCIQAALLGPTVQARDGLQTAWRIEGYPLSLMSAACLRDGIDGLSKDKVPQKAAQSEQTAHCDRVPLYGRGAATRHSSFMPCQRAWNRLGDRVRIGVWSVYGVWQPRFSLGERACLLAKCAESQCEGP